MAYLPTLTPQRRRNLGVAAASAVVIVGATTLFFKTFPHLTPSIFKKSTKTSDDDDDEISESTFIVPKTNVDDWSEEELKAFLKQKEVTPPEGASISDLVALAKSLASA